MFRYIKDGRVSATLSHGGEKQVQLSELLRVFGALQSETVSGNSHRDRLGQSNSDRGAGATVANQLELERLKAQLEFKIAELELAKERISELKTREASQADEKNKLLMIIDRQSLLLTHSPSPARSRTSTSVKAPAAPAKKALTQPVKKPAAKSLAEKKPQKKKL